MEILSLIGWGLLGLCHQEAPERVGRELHNDDKTGVIAQTSRKSGVWLC